MRFPVGVMGYEDVVLPRRKRDSHKGDYGRVLILAGSVGYTGAPVLAASGAVRGGAGLVSLGVPEEIWPIAAVKCLEAMPFPLPARYEDILRRPGTGPGAPDGAAGPFPAGGPEGAGGAGRRRHKRAGRAYR